jgi:hypothetical protein
MPGFGNPVPGRSPDIGNYRVGRGFLSAQFSTDASPVDMGNCPMFEFAVKPTTLPHYSTRQGVQTKDFVAVTRLEGTIDMQLDEITGRNMGLAVLSLSSQSGSDTVVIMSDPLFYAKLIFTDTSSVGPQWQFTFPLVLFTPQKAVSLISQGSGAWTLIDLQCDVLKDPVTASFGWATAAYNFT